jgi:hypothetical protein
MPRGISKTPKETGIKKREAGEQIVLVEISIKETI